MSGPRRALLGGLILLLLAETAARLGESRERAEYSALRAVIPPSHRFIGNLDTSSPRRWNAALRLSGRYAVRLVPDVAFTLHGRGLHLTTPQGFAALSTAEAARRYATPKPAGIYRVVVLGGSAVFGTGARLPDQSLPARLREGLAAALPGRELEVINAGIPGATSAREYLYLESTLLAYEPDLVIVYGGWNDSFFNQVLLSRPGARSPAVLAYAEADEIDARLQASFQVWGSVRQLAANAAGELDMALSSSAAYRRLRPLLPDSSRPRPLARSSRHEGAADMYAHNLKRFISSSHRKGFQLALFLQPVLGVAEKPLTAQEHALIDKAAVTQSAPFYADAERRFAELSRWHKGAGGVCAASLTTAFSAVAEDVYVDAGHINERGNRLVAAAMLRRLRECRLLPGPAVSPVHSPLAGT